MICLISIKYQVAAFGIIDDQTSGGRRRTSVLSGPVSSEEVGDCSAITTNDITRERHQEMKSWNERWSGDQLTGLADVDVAIRWSGLCVPRLTE